jgi:hypothetical protein
MNTEHPVRVDGFNGSLEVLAATICRMRYDKVALFFGLCAVELIRQSNGDMGRGRKRLAVLLAGAAGIASALQTKLEAITRLCIPHMSDDLTPEKVSEWERKSQETKWWVPPKDEIPPITY